MKNEIYIPKGSVVPNWVIKVVKGKKREKYKVKSNGFYVVKHKDGALYMYPEVDGESLMVITNMHNFELKTAPYTKYGGVMFSKKENALKALNEPVINSRGVKCKLC